MVVPNGARVGCAGFLLQAERMRAFRLFCFLSTKIAVFVPELPSVRLATIFPSELPVLLVISYTIW